MQIGELQLKRFEKSFSYKKQIYIVDDDESMCRSLKLLMVSYGFTVDTFSSSEEFFKEVPNCAPGCLILDIHMPKLDGWDAQKRLLESKCNRPVIIISADINVGIKERAFKAGAVGFLQKPFKDKELVNMANLAFIKLEDINDSY